MAPGALHDTCQNAGTEVESCPTCEAMTERVYRYYALLKRVKATRSYNAQKGIWTQVELVLREMTPDEKKYIEPKT